MIGLALSGCHKFMLMYGVNLLKWQYGRDQSKIEHGKCNGYHD